MEFNKLGRTDATAPPAFHDLSRDPGLKPPLALLNAGHEAFPRLFRLSAWRDQLLVLRFRLGPDARSPFAVRANRIAVRAFECAGHAGVVAISPLPVMPTSSDRINQPCFRLAGASTPTRAERDG